MKRIFIFSILYTALFITSCKVRKSGLSSTSVENKRNTCENKNLENEIEEWLGKPYKYGGISKQGVDCSGFVCAIFKSVYNIQVPRTSKQQLEQSIPIKKSSLKEGDLVFFNIDGKGVSHVGIYLNDGKFVHASTSKGVVIDKLTQDYYQKRFVRGGRIQKKL